MATWSPDLSASCSARLRRARPPRYAPRRAEPPVVCSAFGLDRFSSEFNPGHVLRERFTGITRHCPTGRQPGTKGTSRTADKSLINRLLIAGQSLVLFSRRFEWNFACSCLSKNIEVTCLRSFANYDGHLFPTRRFLFAPNLARKRAANFLPRS